MSEEKKTNAALAEPPEGEGANVQSAVDEAGGESKEDLKGKKAPSAAVRRKKKEKKTVAAGRAYINATYNNTIITLTDPGGNAVAWSSAGACGFKGAKKATPYAAQVIVKKAVDKAKEYGLREVAVFVKGVGTGRESAVRALNANGLNILNIKDITPIPHNGCRPRKPRRV